VKSIDLPILPVNRRLYQKPQMKAPVLQLRCACPNYVAPPDCVAKPPLKTISRGQEKPLGGEGKICNTSGKNNLRRGLKSWPIGSGMNSLQQAP
jgi:hypothetical protein